ncbi:hypothetical protein N6H07_23485, partial [Enterobacter cloacae]|uniref:hypothetical protein n=1 Tax=Enterobacter cloacae TaxID=550 RepID=UPI0021BE2FDF
SWCWRRFQHHSVISFSTTLQMYNGNKGIRKDPLIRCFPQEAWLSDHTSHLSERFLSEQI